MSTIVRVRKDGIVLHKHPTSNCSDPEGRWHGPWETHSRSYGQVAWDPEAHKREGAGKPVGLEGLTAAQRKQYALALLHSSPGTAGSALGVDPTRTAEYLASRAPQAVVVKVAPVLSPAGWTDPSVMD